MATTVDQGNLQQGIYLSPDHRPPNSFLFLVIDLACETDGAGAAQGIERMWEMLAELRRGLVRDLVATRDGERGERIDPDTFDVLLGYGASLFDPDRGLTRSRRPDHVTPLGHNHGPFPGLRWAPGIASRSGEGDLCLQLTGRDDHAVSRAAVEVWKLVVDENLPMILREAHHGFARDDGRSWIGFHDGVSNIRRSQRRAAVECTGDPDWNRGGTYLAFLRCEIDLKAWRELSREEQEMLVGRDMLTGCALERVVVENGKLTPRAFSGCPAREGATPEERDIFRDPPETGDEIVEASHIHRANQNRAEPTTPAAHRIFRQGYEYLESIGPDGPRLGLNFVSFQRDLEHLRQILGLRSWLGEVNFGGPAEPEQGQPRPIQLIGVRAGGLYAVPPRESPFPGARLFR